MRLTIVFLAGLLAGIYAEGPLFMSALKLADECSTGPVCALSNWYAHTLQDY